MKKTITATAISGILFMSMVLPAYADPIPNFGSCINPQWNQIQVNYGSNHGVVNVGTFAGTDTIYSSNGKWTKFISSCACLCSCTN